jgi:hypothetical protein
MEAPEKLVLTAGGNQIEHDDNEATSKSLIALWTELGIQDIEK